MRSGLLGALALAVAATACVGSGSELSTTAVPVAPESTVTTGSVTTTSAATAEVSPPSDDERYAWQAGDCLRFTTTNDLDLLPHAPYGDDDIVPCADAHTHEVFRRAQVDEGEADAFPGEALSLRVAAECTAAFAEHTGANLADSWYELLFYLPDAEEWAAGERYLACVLYRLDRNGLVREQRGRVERNAAAATWPVAAGDCLRGAAFAPRYGGPIPCGDTHTHEVIADLVYPDAEDAAYPGPTALLSGGGERCADAFADAGGDTADAQVTLAPRLIGRADWDLGYRRLLCVATVFTAGGDLAEGRGSLLDRSWQPSGIHRDEPALTA